LNQGPPQLIYRDEFSSTLGLLDGNSFFSFFLRNLDGNSLILNQR